MDSRTSDDNTVVRRRRECPDCRRRFTSYERAGEMRVFVIKKDGRREPFDRAKVVAGITKACEKRPVSRESVEQIADEVERRLRDELSEEVATTEIGAMVMERLRGVDEVAYVRFASVYKEFRDADSFLKEIEDVLRSPRAEPAAGVQPGLFDSQE